ncbi:SHOCT domain-containing protein [Emticicia sp. C21]|uniref:SHOCT domain-containing protein n=1 Tax=Emticicia sp. C21 TaxID=2302915 RepID=UPI000E34FE32|nr:SHOCT domain-containing protein [Emticicia sp. C21]RFS15055.1 SHOCT domain-containing protein [Emticicia sp. C21]
MKTLKVMSIIGIVWMGLCFIVISTVQNDSYYDASKANIDTLAGWGYFGLLYLLAFSIVALIHANKQSKLANLKESKIKLQPSNTSEKLIQLDELRQKGILSEDEFQAMKIDILRK